MRIKVLFTAAFFLLAGGLASAQQQMTPEQREKQLYENIQKQVDSYASSLDLEDWQIFYADSILTHNFGEMAKEFEELSNNRVGNTDLYAIIQDKWMEENYKAFEKILDKDQLAKYLKQGASRDKKARDKRAQKREKQK